MGQGKARAGSPIGGTLRRGSSPIAHMWHMPGHIYDGLHRYADAAWQQQASARVDHARMIHDRILPDHIHNYAHNNEWLIRDLVNVGRVRDAMALSKNMIELPRHPQYNLLTKASSWQHGRNRLLDVLVRCELWDELIALAGTPYLEPTDIPAEQVKRLRAWGAAGGHGGHARDEAKFGRNCRTIGQGAGRARCRRPGSREQGPRRKEVRR